MSAENPTPTRDSKVTLREITEDTVRAICRLKVHDDQKGFLADNATSIAEAHFSPHAWFRAIYADETPVGFVMVEDKPDVPEYFLERFMIDIRYQRLKFGRQAMEQVIEHIKTRPNATHFLTSVHQEPGGPPAILRRAGVQAHRRHGTRARSNNAAEVPEQISIKYGAKSPRKSAIQLATGG